jgi:transposase-like protein
MSGRNASVTDAALKAVTRGTATITQVAEKFGIAITTLRRAMRRAGEAPRLPGRPPYKRRNR